MPERRSGARGGNDRGDIVARLSRGFGRIAGWAYDHRWVVLGAWLMGLAGAAILSAKVRFDNSFEAYFDTHDPVYRTYQQYREDFGSDEVSYIVYAAPEAPYGPWNLDVMRRIGQLTEELEREVPFVDEVTSLVNVEFIDSIPGGLEIHELLEDFPRSQEELLRIRDKVLAKPLYVNSLVSADGRYAAIVLEMDRSSIDPVEEIKLDPDGGTNLENLYPQASYHRIERILAEPEYEGIEFYHTGDVALNAVYNTITQSESARLGNISFVVIAIILLYFLHTPLGVLGPLAVVGASLVLAIGFVGLVGWELDLMFTMLPPLLIAVGVADAVHILCEFRAQYVAQGSRRAAIRETLYLVGTPCLLTSLTTAAGFSAMAISPIKAIYHFAVYSALGVVFAFGLSVTFLIVLVSLGRARSRRAATEHELERARGGHRMQSLLAGICRFDLKHRKAILVTFGLLFVFSALGTTRLRVDSNFMNEFSDRVLVKRVTEFVDETMGGNGSLVYLFDGRGPDSIKKPAALAEIERVQHEAERHDFLVRKTRSVVDTLKDINQSFHEGDPGYSVTPKTRDLVAQYLLLYEMSGGEEIEEQVSTDYSRAPLELRCKLVESSEYIRLAGRITDYLEREPLDSTRVTVTGMGALWMKLVNYITRSQIRGFLLAFVVIAAMMCFVFRSVKIGLLSMIPNLSPVFLTLGAMGWLGIPLDYVRLLIGTIAIGISVDDTIHLVTRYVHEYRRSGSYEEALFESMREVGRALLITSVVLVAGFLVFLPSILDTLVTFGLLVSGTIFVALVADFLLMPALVLTVRPFGESLGLHAERVDRIDSPA